MGGIGDAVRNQGVGASPASAGSIGDLLKAAGSQAALEAKVDRLTKLVHILWKEAERLESIVQITPGGLRIKTGMSEMTLLRDGSITINGMNISVKSAAQISLKSASENDLWR